MITSQRQTAVTVDLKCKQLYGCVVQVLFIASQRQTAVTVDLECEQLLGFVAQVLSIASQKQTAVWWKASLTLSWSPPRRVEARTTTDEL